MVQRLNDKNESLQQKLAAMTLDKDSANKNINALNQELNRTKATVEEKDAALTKLVRENETANAQLAEIKKIKTDLEKDFIALESQLKETEARFPDQLELHLKNRCS